MAEAKDAIEEKVLTDAKRLLWGNDLKEEVFLRWSQGII